MVWMYVGLGAAGLILLLVGIIMMLVRKKKKERCEYKTTAVLCDVKSYSSRSGEVHNKMHHAVYEYQYGGKTYYKESPVGTSSMPKIGKKEDVYINPNKPKECYMKSFGMTFTTLLLIVLGIIFVALTAVLFFTVGV